MSDSGAQDKVMLKTGQRGTVKKIIDSGHASVDFSDHKKLQWVAKGNLTKLKVDGDDEDAVAEPEEAQVDDAEAEAEDEEEYGYDVDVASSALRCKVLSELNDALDSGFARRLERLERRFQLLQNGAAAPTNGSTAAPSPPQEEETAMRRVSTKNLARAVKKALSTRSAAAKRYGPSRKQSGLQDPPEKQEEILLESQTLQLTLQAVDQNVVGRRRQIVSLRSQVDVAEECCNNIQRQVDAASSSEKSLLSDDGLLRKTHADGIERRVGRVDVLRREKVNLDEQARSLKEIMINQRRYLMQHDRVAQICGGSQGVLRHKAGDIFLAPQPLPLDVRPPETWDVGTAVANPYNVDSWPFEPNVLARRTFSQDPSLEPFREETPEDLDEKRSMFRNPFLPGLRMPARDEEEEECEDYGAPSGTSRSL